MSIFVTPQAELITVVGALLHNHNLAVALECLPVDAIHDGKLRAVYSALTRCKRTFDEGADADGLMGAEVFAVWDAMSDRDRELVGWPWFLKLYDLQHAMLSFPHALPVVLRDAKARAFAKELAHQHIDAADQENAKRSDEWLEESTAAMADAVKRATLAESKDDAPDAVARRCLASAAKSPTLIETGISTLDRALGGFEAGELVVVGARSKVGKTALLFTMAVAAARAGRKVLYFSGEMTSEAMVERWVSFATGIPAVRLRTRDLSPEEVQARVEAYAEWSTLGIRAVGGEKRVDEIAAKCDRHPDHSLVIVDYCQRFRPPAGVKYGVREQEVAAVIRYLKAMAVERKLVCLTGAQLNREAENRTDKIPHTTDLRESDVILHEGDIVLLLHRDLAKDTAKAKLFVAACRFGAGAVVELHFDAPRMRFTRFQ